MTRSKLKSRFNYPDLLSLSNESLHRDIEHHIVSIYRPLLNRNIDLQTMIYRPMYCIPTSHCIDIRVVVIYGLKISINRPLWNHTVMLSVSIYRRVLSRSIDVSSAPCLVQPTATDVSHPLDDVMVAVVQFGFEHLQVSNLEPGRSKRNLEVHGDRRASPFLLGVSL